MDQNKTFIPRLLNRPKSVDGKQLPTHIYGMLVNRDEAHFCVDFRQIAHDINCVMTNVLSAAVNQIRNHCSSKVPRVLYLSFDNTTAENKNRYMLGLCSFLVGSGIFDKVKLFFQLVGHTHNEVDALFGLLARRFRYHQVLSPDDLAETIKSSNRSVRSVSWRLGIWDYRSWVIPNLLEIEGFKYVHCFKFKRNKNGDPRMWYKSFSHDEVWRPSAEGLEILKDGSLQSMDVSQIRLATPRWEDSKVVKAMCKGEPSIVDDFRPYLTGSQVDSWIAFQETVRKMSADDQSYLEEVTKSEIEPISSLWSLIQSSKNTNGEHATRSSGGDSNDGTSATNWSSEEEVLVRSIRDKNRRVVDITSSSTRKRRALAIGSDTPTVGALLIVYPGKEEHSDTTPWMGRVTSVNEAELTFELHWMQSSKEGVDGTWSPMFLKPDRKGKSKTGRPYLSDDLSFETILVFDAQLTKIGRIDKSTLRRWQDAMSDMRGYAEQVPLSSAEDSGTP